ncbi:hypothetical protein [Allopontixanthobacter sp.]|uniref:hypothetical protein n=1 Tax=Allopontixanthobacter sp. TaxID=2906452 RepID=UPI002AB90673|nr:hypothetical protein [Allopontixanthobacter sp.]MDZ4308100.1 hypothetical protein [Allopontixanthobacter sp.]
MAVKVSNTATTTFIAIMVSLAKMTRKFAQQLGGKSGGRNANTDFESQGHPLGLDFERILARILSDLYRLRATYTKAISHA